MILQDPRFLTDLHIPVWQQCSVISAGIVQNVALTGFLRYRDNQAAYYISDSFYNSYRTSNPDNQIH